MGKRPPRAKPNPELTEYKITELQDGFRAIGGRLDKIDDHLAKQDVELAAFLSKIDVKNQEGIARHQESMREIEDHEKRIGRVENNPVVVVVAAAGFLISKVPVIGPIVGGNQ